MRQFRLNIGDDEPSLVARLLTVVLVGTPLIVLAAYVSMRLSAPPPGFASYDFWQFALRSKIALAAGLLVASWLCASAARFVVRPFSENAFAVHLALFMGAAAAAGYAFVRVSSTHGAWAIAVSAAVHGVVAVLVILSATWVAPDGLTGAPMAVIKVFWAFIGHFVLPLLTLVALAWIIVRVNRAGPLAADTTLLTTIAAVVIGLLVVGLGTYRVRIADFRPSATYVATSIASQLVSLGIAFALGTLMVRVAGDHLGGWLIRAFGTALAAGVLWVLSIVAVAIGLGTAGWVAEQAGIPVQNSPMSAIVRRGRIRLED